MTESCPAGVQKVFLGPRDRESPKRHLRRCKQGLRPCNPVLRQCNEPFVPTSAKTFCTLSKALWATSANLTSVPRGLVCNVWVLLGKSSEFPEALGHLSRSQRHANIVSDCLLCFEPLTLISLLKLYTPPFPPPPQFGQKTFFRERGGGVYILKPPRQDFIRPPLFYAPPHP